MRRAEDWSGDLVSVLYHHLAGGAGHILGAEGPGKKTHILSGVIASRLKTVAEHQHRQAGHPGVKLGYERRTTQTGQMISRDNEPEVLCKSVLLNETKRLRGVSNPLNIRESLLEGRHTHERL